MIHTRGNIVVEDIKIGDIHYEFEFNGGKKYQVISKPIRNECGIWNWESINLKTKKISIFSVDEKNSYFSPKLYTFGWIDVIKIKNETNYI